jgi:orotate phosphoribosyltransferase
MTAEYNILHITDLHLEAFDGTKEHLRKRFFKEYIDGLVDLVNGQSLQIDFVAMTGDFVDKGRTENFIHIIEIIDYLVAKFKLDRSRVGVCIGNHDYKYKEEPNDGTNSQEVRKPFSTFAGNFCNGKSEKNNERGSLSRIEENLFFLSIDSTLGSHHEKLKGKPGNISDEEIDIIVNDFVKDSVPSGSVLLIGCHYPIEMFPDSVGYSSEDDWTANHFWAKAAHLRNRINAQRGLKKIWLMGDTHMPDHLRYQHDDVFYVMTGRFGGSTDSRKPSYLFRQCKVVSTKENGQDIVTTFSFEMAGHEDSSMGGRWRHEVSDIRSLHMPLKTIEKPESDNTAAELKSRVAIELISDVIQETLVNRVIEFDLYLFGRFITSSNKTSLGWISINPLLNETKLLASIVTKTSDRILEKILCAPEEAAIVGIDFWGAIIGSQVSVLTGVTHYCVATRGNGQYHTSMEFRNQMLYNRVKSVAEIVIISDVVSCGGTIEKIIGSIFQINPKIKVHLVSVVANTSSINFTDQPNIISFGSFCVAIKIPIVSNDFLPDERMLPANIDFSIRPEA